MPQPQKQNPSGNKPPQTQTSKSNGDDIWGRVDYASFLLYGESGTGKTTLWGSFPGPLKVFICSGGNRPGELKSINTPEHRKKIEPVVINESDELCDLITTGQAHKDKTTWVLDHASGLLSLLTKEDLGLDDLPAVKKWGMGTQQDWGRINEKCINILRHFLNLPGYVVIVAQERMFKGKDENAYSEIVKPTIGASLTPGVVNWLNPSCDYVMQMFKRPKMVASTVEANGKQVTQWSRGKGIEYCARTEPHEFFMTKFRVPKGRSLPEVIVDPSFDKIMKIINGK